MSNRKRRMWRLMCTLLLASGCLLAVPLGAAPAPAPSTASLQQAFSNAAAEFGVPPRVLLAVAYNLSRWETHGGAPSTSGGYGPMHLTHVGNALRRDGKGDGMDRLGRPLPSDASLHRLDAAAALVGVDPEVLKRDPAQNIRGGAALLAQFARDTTGTLPTAEADWYGAVAKYSGSQEAAVALDFADVVYATMQQGVSRTTTDGQRVTLTAGRVTPNTSTSNTLALHHRIAAAETPECPSDVACEFIPAAYQLNNPADPSDYGNYDLANRPRDGLDIRYIVIHDTEVDYAGTLAIFQNPLSYVSTHYVLRSVDGHIAQMVRNANVAWHAGNWYVNGHSIGLEHEGFAIEGATWYTEAMYRASAKLVRYLADKYSIPLDRAHIIGHDDIPHPTTGQAAMHWDPGPFWDWAHYMDLLGAPITPTGRATERGIVTINPNFATNQPPLTYCYGDAQCPGNVAPTPVPPQPSNFVYLRTAPSFDAPLIGNPYLSTPGTTQANDWSNKAVTGQQFYRIDRQGEWDAIYFSGQVAWFYNPADNRTAVPSTGLRVTPKAGLASIPVYGRAYPEDAAYPKAEMIQPILPIELYQFPAGQQYVAVGPFKSDYYWAPTYAANLEYSDHQVITGETEYYQIFYNHRFAFVRADDVEVIADRHSIFLPMLNQAP